MGRVCQCPYKTSFLCYFLEFAHPCFNFVLIQGNGWNYIFFGVNDNNTLKY
jgi:hypothetical protein